MQTTHPQANLVATAAAGLTSMGARWLGRVLSALALAFLAMDTAGKLAQAEQVVASTTQLGYAAAVIPTIGLIQLLCVALYALPRTALFGAVLLTGYPGGAVATHLRVGSPVFTHVLFPVYVAAFVWGGLWLRDARLRAFVASCVRT